MCQIIYFSRKYDEAIDYCQKAIDLKADFLTARLHLYEIYTAKEMYPEAFEQFFIAEELNMTSSAFPDQHAVLKNAYSTGGIRGFWQKRIELLNKSERAPAYELGKYFARLDRNEEAMFKLAAERRDFDFLFFATDLANRNVLLIPEGRNLADQLTGSGNSTRLSVLTR